MVVKLAPDIAEDDLEPIVKVLISRGVDGIAVSNSTLARERLSDAALAKEAGGVSGRPLFHRSTVMLARVYELTGGRIPLIGIGGIDSGAAAIAKLEAGATLLQLYTGLVYGGRPAGAHQAGDRRPSRAREARAHRRCHRPPCRGVGCQVNHDCVAFVSARTPPNTDGVFGRPSP